MFIKASPADARALEKLINGAYRGDHSAKGWTSEAHLLDGQRTDQTTLLQQLNAPDALFLRDPKDPPRACVLLQKHDDNCHISMLTVDPNAQGSGLGSKLLKAAEDFAQLNWGSQATTMNVISLRRELVAFYERRGYRATGQSTPFPTDPKFGIPKVADLVLIEMKKVLSEE